MTASALAVSDLVVGYGGPPVVRQASCTAAAGTMLAVVGASGSGKTTLLRAIAGFIPVTSGTILIGDRMVDGAGVMTPPERRNVGIVTQDGSLFPHLTVARNVGFGLPRRMLPDGTPTSDRVDELLHLVGLSGLGDRSPHELSGGQQQRVALARALAPRPDVVLLDEPFSALDAGLRIELGTEVRDLLQSAGTTTVLVTHDQDEALSLADSVAVMIDGRIAQQGAPEEVYARPSSLEVADFLGEVVVLPVLSLAAGVATTVLGDISLDPTEVSSEVPHRVALRPEQLVVMPAPHGDREAGVVEAVVYHGHDSMIEVRLPDGAVVRARALGSTELTRGDPVRVAVTGAGQRV